MNRDDETRRLLKRWRFERTPARGEPEPTNAELGRLARETLWELEQLWERPGGHPTEDGTFRDELARALCAHLLYHGTFPLGDAPDGLRLPWVEQTAHRYNLERGLQNCKGSRKRSDKAAAGILNSSVSQVQKARGKRINPDGTWWLSSVPGGHVVDLTEPEQQELWEAVRRSRG